MPAILDVAIGTIFVFLLFSITVTALNEIWLSLLDKRAAFLKEGLEELLKGDPAINLPGFFGHGLISSLSRGVYAHVEESKKPGFLKQIAIAFLPDFVCRKLGWTLGTRGVPSYIPGKSFVLTLLSFVDDETNSRNRTALAQQVSLILDPTLRDRLTGLIAAGGSAAALLALRNEAAALQLALAPAASANPAAPPPPPDPIRTAALQADASLLETLPEVFATVKDLRTQIATGSENSKLRKTLLALYDDAAGDLDRFKANIENWFNQSMDRVSGWYKRYAQQWLFALSFILAVACNVDSIRIIRTLSEDPKLRASVVAQAEKYSRSHRNQPDVTTVQSDSQNTVIVNNAVPPAGAADPGPAAAAPENSEEHKTEMRQKAENFQNALAELGGTGIPMGWSSPAGVKLLNAAPWTESRAITEKGTTPSRALGTALWLSALAGWFLTALAASLGAPFWFDTLNRFVDLRGVGRAPEEKDPTAPKKKITGDESYLERSTPADAR